MKHKCILMLAVFIAVGLLAGGVHAASYSSMVVFGDSLSDSGNLFTFTGGAVPASPPYFQGRFSNGPVWVENLRQRLDIAPEQLLNFATGGATSGTANITVPEGPGLLTQIDAFAASGNLVGPQALYVVWAGANDLRGDVTNPEAVISTAVTNIATAISTLAALGASTILVPNLPDLGKVPEILDHGDEALSAEATALSVAFNEALATSLDSLERVLEINIITLDVFILFEAVVADPGVYGVGNVTERCLTTNQRSVCDSPEQHLFWDGRHPTVIGHDILANAVADDVLDSNGDGISDIRALALGLDPFVADADSDFDGTSDADEIGHLDKPLDTDGDGIIDAAEPGDAALDSLALVFRVPDVCCQFPLALRGQTVSLTATGADTLVSINNPDWRLPIYSESQVAFDPVFNYPLGLYSLTLMVSNGGTATVVVQFPADVGIPVDAVYRRVDAAGSLRTDNSAEINMTNKTVTLTLTDGGSGDEDGGTDGVIIHTGGIGQPVSFDVPDLDLDFGFGGTGGCFIATAAYGSYDAPHVQILRNFRDRFLLPNAVGRWLVGQYYIYSPPAAAWIAQHESWRAMVRILLLPLIGISWLLTEAAPEVQALVGLVLLSLLWFAARYLRTSRMSLPPAE